MSIKQFLKLLKSDNGLSSINIFPRINNLIIFVSSILSAFLIYFHIIYNYTSFLNSITESVFKSKKYSFTDQ